MATLFGPRIARAAVATVLRADADNWPGFLLMLAGIRIAGKTDSIGLRVGGSALLAVGLAVSIRCYRVSSRLRREAR